MRRLASRNESPARPRASSAMIRGAELVGAGEIPDEVLPDYMKRKFNIKVHTGKDANGREQLYYVTGSGLIPVSDIVDLAKLPVMVPMMLASKLSPVGRSHWFHVDHACNAPNRVPLNWLQR